MEKLEHGNIRLRPLELGDVDLLYKWENDLSVWEVSNTLAPFSKHTLEQYVLNVQQQDVYASHQLRLIVENKEGQAIGAIDLFEVDLFHQRAGVGILIHQSEDRRKGYATDALMLICDYAQHVLGMHQLFANITDDNQVSIHLFEKCGFQLSGTKKDWIKSGRSWKDEMIFQKMLD